MNENFEHLCDEEKSFNSWFIENSELCEKEREEIIGLLKKTYMQGYAAGFSAKLKYLSEEQLQK